MTTGSVYIIALIALVFSWVVYEELAWHRYTIGKRRAKKGTGGG